MQFEAIPERHFVVPPKFPPLAPATSLTHQGAASRDPTQPSNFVWI